MAEVGRSPDADGVEVRRVSLFRALPSFQQQAPPLRLIAPGWSATIAFVTALIVAAVGFASLAPFPRTQRAVGYVTPAGGVVRVLPPRSGVVEKILVRTGDRVRAGQALFTLAYGERLVDGRELDAVQSDALARQIAILDRQIATERSRGLQTEADARARVGSLSAQVASLRTQFRLQSERADVAERQLKALESLRDKGIVSATQYAARQDNALSQRQAGESLLERIAALGNELRQARFDVERARSDSMDRLAQLELSRVDLGQRREEASARGTQVIGAPVPGEVVMLQASAGQSVNESRPLLAIAPLGVRFRAELFLGPEAIGLIRAGQRVRLTYDAFPVRRFGAYRGTVDSVSPILLSPDDIVGAVRPAAPAHRVGVRLDRQSVEEDGRIARLSADLTVQADILLERRTVLEWFVDALTGAGQ